MKLWAIRIGAQPGLLDAEPLSDHSEAMLFFGVIGVLGGLDLVVLLAMCSLAGYAYWVASTP